MKSQFQQGRKDKLNMIRPISNVYLIVNGQSINVGKVICECDQGSWFNKPNEYITNTEWEERKRSLK